MSVGMVAAGGIALYGLHRLIRGSEKDHMNVLEDAYRSLDDATEKGTLYLAHQDEVDIDTDNHPKGELPDTDHVPDIIYTRFEGASLVVEVETGDTLDSDALAQLEDFSTPGYKRVLVVPDSAVEDGIQFLKETADGNRQEALVCGPSELPEAL